MFRNLIPKLADRYHVIAPDYPGYGNSEMPSIDEFEYTFDNMANVVDTLLQELRVRKYSLYLMDYGAPVGFRVATRHPERIESLIIQNGNAYDEGLREFWKPLKAYWKDQSPKNAEALKGLLTVDATKWQYTHGVLKWTPSLGPVLGSAKVDRLISSVASCGLPRACGSPAIDEVVRGYRT
jgi:pimeloyl-ACP methyl ester carboxylesterase